MARPRRSLPVQGSVAQLRWDTVDGDGGGGQGELFEPVAREMGRGEYRGLEFLHVQAKRIINQVRSGGHLPFEYTINAYRGCSHACTYCLAGDTPVLMADGTSRPLGALRVGDRIYGTRRRGVSRRYVLTEVLAHWATARPAVRVSRDDGTELVASADHRLLAEAGWRSVASPGSPPGLTTADVLLGPGCDAPAQLLGTAVKGNPGQRVTAVKPVGQEVPMYDITTGTGDFIAAGVVSHNCFARPTHEYLGLGIGTDFDQRIVVKINAPERLRAELHPARWGGHPIAMGTNTDPYQRCEGKYRLTRGIVENLVEAANPFSVLTKSTLVLRDLDLLAEAAQVTDVRVNLSIGTVDPAVWRVTEPGTPHPARRLRAVGALNQAGVPCGVLVAPVLPGLSDGDEQLRAVAAACVEAGARSVSTVVLHLRPGVKEHFITELGRTHPHLVARYRSLYPAACSNAPRDHQRRAAAVVGEAVRAAGGLPAGPSDPGHHTGRGRAEAKSRHPAARRPDQLRLDI